MNVLKRVCSAKTNEAGQLTPNEKLELNCEYVICRDIPIGSVKPRESREKVAEWIDACVLGDLRTLKLGIDKKPKPRDQHSSSEKPLGGGNFLLVAGCCMTLEYFGQVYGKGSDGTSRAKKYVVDFLAKFDQRYGEFFELLWSSFRNGIVHGSWPQGICVQGYREERLVVGANNSEDGPHLEPLFDYPKPSFVISSVRFLKDLEISFDKGFRNWIIQESDEEILHQFHRLIRPGDRLRIGARIAALYPTAAGAALVIRLEAADAAGRPVFTEHGGALFRSVGCAGPGRGLENLPEAGPPPEEPGRPLWEADIPIPRVAAHVYSACSGIAFPIHTSMAFAKSAGLPDIILHGTATLALAARELLNREAGGEPARLEEIGCRFTGLVIPGSSIRVQLLGKEQRGEDLRLAFSVQNGQGRPALRWGLARLGLVSGGAGR